MPERILPATAPPLNHRPPARSRPPSIAPPPPPGPHGFAARTTDDLFLGAYLVAEGARLAGTERNGRTVAFVIEGEVAELDELWTAYGRGEARTNVLRFKGALTHLKDVMFARLRSEDRADDRSADSGAERRGEERCRYRSRSSSR